MIKPEIEYDDLENILTICNYFQLAAIELSIGLEIIQTNVVADVLFVKKKNQLLNKSFNDICKEFGFTFSFSDVHQANQSVTLSVAHWITDKKIVDVTWTTSRIFKAGECIGILLVGKIIANHLVNQSPLMLENLLDKHSIGVFSKDIDGNFLSFNDYMAGLTGFKKEELTGKNDYLMPWAAEADIYRQADILVNKEHSTLVFDEYIKIADGTQRCSHVTKSSLLDAQGNIVGTIGTAVIRDHPIYSMLPSEFSHNDTLLECSNIYLTQKEMECIRWMIKGKSALEIASIVHASPRTIETHLNNVKRKLNCFKQFQLGYLFGRYGHLLM